jgi:hypothetical protein
MLVKMRNDSAVYTWNRKCSLCKFKSGNNKLTLAKRVYSTRNLPTIPGAFPETDCLSRGRA